MSGCLVARRHPTAVDTRAREEILAAVMIPIATLLIHFALLLGS